ncbi:hypothetical protein CY34DRAFT_531864 [Suillus luteus UH-Slu-Lm8-n1]|uniref:Uncharacterized protein n=1 Tax=Suillus luteus UH-Slu-Lm8-n1 TaxID=930992 RepID=A0A0C9ZFP3_9AGAM|nr:hypothetical protein CY34DRAFT_531864 [Suillus luteus UH-Slu-Lm8-n1]
MASPISIVRALLLFGIYISNIVAVVILRLLIFASTTRISVILSAVSSILTLLVIPVVLIGGRLPERFPEISNTRYLIAFVVLGVLDLPSCITLPLRARQDNGTALCQDLSQSSDCTSAHVLIGCYYTAVIFAFIALVITCIERLTGSAPKVSPRYPIVREAGSPFAVIQYPAHDVDLDILFTEIPTRKAKQAYAVRSNQSPV